MGLDIAQRRDSEFFYGTEVEHTPNKGAVTLFVKGLPSVEDIKQQLIDTDVTHIYFGTTQSFHPESPEECADWERVIKYFLDLNYHCTLDFDVQYVPEVLEMMLEDRANYTSVISVKIPYVASFNYNATLKIDDNHWGDTNTGVWCHSLHELRSRATYTDWSDYSADGPSDGSTK